MSESLYERIGGAAAMEAAVGLFYRKVLSDPHVSDFFISRTWVAKGPSRNYF